MGVKHHDIIECLKRQPRIVRLPEHGQAVFVGDTHGDIEATETVLDRYLRPGFTVVFLGDYVDRGQHSIENISLLLSKKLEAPDRLHLLMGNHECYSTEPFHPADFWESLARKKKNKFSEIFKHLPLAAVSRNGLLALHGVPPLVKARNQHHALETLETTKLGCPAWETLVWGDFSELQNPMSFRPTFGGDHFKKAMDRFGKKVLIRAHQWNIQPIIFDRCCLTLMTSSAYKVPRRIAVADLEKPSITSTDEVQLIELPRHSHERSSVRPFAPVLPVMSTSCGGREMEAGVR